MQDETFKEICKYLSNERLGSYDDGGSVSRNAIGRYAWNIALCEAFYPAFHLLEVTLRNSTDLAFTQKYGGDWLGDRRKFPLAPHELKRLDDARETLRRQGRSIRRGKLIGELPFSGASDFRVGRTGLRAFHGRVLTSP